MKYYFLLQYARIKRKLIAAGISPFLGLLLAVLMFISLSKYLFFSTTYAPWIYAFIALSFIFQMGDKKRTEPIQIIFNKIDFIKIRVLENTLTLLPFFLYLLYENQWITGISLLVIAILSTTLKTRTVLNFALPTPFRKFPFEFIAGFRTYLLLIFAGYFLTGKAIQVDNFNLGLFSLVLIFFTGMSFYLKPENEYYVWIYNSGGKSFLWKKMGTGLICISVLTLPVLIALWIRFPENIVISAGIQLLGYVFLASMVLAKYSAFPSEMSVPQGLLYGLSLWSPPYC